MKHRKHRKHAAIDAADLPALVRAGWSEAEFTKAVIELARENGWLAAHFRPARTAAGWRTAVQGDGAGFVDLVLLKSSRMITPELKVGRNKPTPAQERWLTALRAAGIAAPVWYPHDWPVIVAVLTAGKE